MVTTPIAVGILALLHKVALVPHLYPGIQWSSRWFPACPENLNQGLPSLIMRVGSQLGLPLIGFWFLGLLSCLHGCVTFTACSHGSGRCICVVVVGFVVVVVGPFFCLQSASLSTSSSKKAFSTSIRISLLASSGALLLTLVSGSGHPSARSSSCTIFTLCLYRAYVWSAPWSCSESCMDKQKVLHKANAYTSAVDMFWKRIGVCSG